MGAPSSDAIAAVAGANFTYKYRHFIAAGTCCRASSQPGMRDSATTSFAADATLGANRYHCDPRYSFGGFADGALASGALNLSGIGGALLPSPLG